MNKEEQILYIYNKCNNNDVYDNMLIKNIYKHNIHYTQNKNGIFLNLSKCNENDVNILYNNIKNNKLDGLDENRDILLKKYKNNLENKKTKEQKIKKKYKKFENLNDIDLDIINYSKKI